MLTILPEVIPFDAAWRFTLGDSSEYSAVAFNDASWRLLDVPHDWSIEDLAPRTSTNDVFEVRNGTWLFKRGGQNASWEDPSLDESGWMPITVPSDWRVAANYTDEDAFGWYRRHLDATDEQVPRDGLLLALGAVSARDVTYLNGVEIGKTAGFNPNCNDYIHFRSYAIPKGLLKPKDNVIAVQVFSKGGQFPGGLYDHPVLRNGDVRQGPFDAAISAGTRATGYTVGGVGWYRKHFQTPASLAPGGVASLTFDGVYMNSDLYLNGQHVRSQPYGYSTFVVDVTPHLRTDGAENVLAVRVANTGRNSRWYSGSGIFRHVRLAVQAAVRLPAWGVAVSTPHVSAAAATVRVDATVASTRPAATRVLVSVVLAGPSGERVARGAAPLTVPAAANATASLMLRLASPQRWGPDTPSLYQATVSVLEQTAAVEEAVAAGAEAADAAAAGAPLDVVTETFGIRTVEWDASFGLRLNGEAIELRGGCVHHGMPVWTRTPDQLRRAPRRPLTPPGPVIGADNGPLGSATIDRAEARRVELLKANGYNAIRTSHNPVSPAFLAACDRVGMLVMDEAFDWCAALCTSAPAPHALR